MRHTGEPGQDSQRIQHVLPIDHVGLLRHDDVIGHPHRVEPAILGAAYDLEHASHFDRAAVVWQADSELHAGLLGFPGRRAGYTRPRLTATLDPRRTRDGSSD